ncbi:NAD(P)-binding domain-containing protein [Rhodococcus antarcticus]|jgi:3-hydroxyisobutyrate dehydrogenase|uniref:NAD(P)-binding domain-containing protein n=1 Tax=Rhodococcus antarcticus TaxID=2987751 RepID=A0ABY6P4D4_9NOCA|nr:NAD(P)-binding domain-containing protein [Rhodococcus antarcticus]UZJ26388.1 NAD(P)-binding domain-containing protein [Rhodococcus antarcticus]
MRIALLGTGRMATHLGRHLINAGHELTVWNRTADRTAPLVEAGAAAAASPAEAVAEAELVVTVLFGPPSVRETVINADLLGEGSLWLDVTTVGPEDADFQAAWSSTKGVRYVAGPVLGSMAPAQKGALGVLLGGAPEDVAAVKDVVLLWGDEAKVRELPTARDAAAGKLVANLALGVALQGVAEALTFASDVGLDRDTTLSILAGSVLAPVVAAKKDKLAERDFDDAEFTANALIKDMDLVLSATLGLHAVQAAHDALEAAIEDGRGDEDFSVIADV